MQALFISPKKAEAQQSRGGGMIARESFRNEASDEKKRNQRDDGLPFLPDELVREILCRLPVKSLLRFQAVCRAWRALIQDPSFADLQITLSNQDPCITTLGFFPDPRRLFLLDLDPNRPAAGWVPTRLSPPLDDSPAFSFCNGLLCFVKVLQEHVPLHVPRASRFCFPGGTLSVCNPITGECISLPQSPLPFRDSFHFGIGFVSATGEYKVVRIVSRRRTVAEICTLGESLSWRYLGNLRFRITGTLFGGLFADGALFWWMDGRHRAIAKMDVRTEKFCTIELPETLSKYPLRMVEWKRGFGVVEHDDHGGDNQIRIWVLKEFPQEEEEEGGKRIYWSKVVTIQRGLLDKNWCVHVPLGILRNGEMLVLYDVYTLRSFLMRGKRFGSIQIQLPITEYFLLHKAFYRPSLVRPRRQ